MKKSAKDILGRNLKTLRETRGWTQAELCRRSGVPQTTISATERSVHAPTLDTLDDLAKAFGVLPWILLFESAGTDLPDDQAAKVIDAYVRLPEDGRAQIARVAEAESRYHLKRC